MVAHMTFRPAVSGHAASLVICLAFAVSFVLPCLCMTEGPASHCGGREGGFNVTADCCCGGALPGASETMAKVIPTPTAAPLAAGVLPVSFTILHRVSAAPATRSSHGSPALLVLRI
jgi:hypothetical protein